MTQPAWSGPPSGPTLRPFAHGALWSAVNALGGVALPFLVFIAFTRWLQPAEVGVAVLATSLAEVVKAFGATGLYEALLQQGAFSRRHHEAASATLLFLGVGLTLVFVALIAVLSAFLPSIAAAGWPIDLIGLRIFFDLATTQPQAALAQRLSFGRMASRSIIANVGAGLIGGFVGWAAHPFDGLIAYLICQSALICVTTSLGTTAMARPVLHLDCLRDMRREAFAATVVRLFAATNNYLDQIVVAAAMGSAQLAFFNFGKRVETTFITAASSFATILFQPLFSLDGAPARSRSLRNGLAMLTMICGAPAAVMITNATGVIRIVLGDRWVEAAPVAALLACSGFARTLGSVHGALLSVSRRNRQLTWVTSASAIGGLAIVIALTPLGIVSVAAGLAVKNILMVAWMATLTINDLPRSGRIYLAVVGMPFGAMLGAGLGARALLAATGPGGTMEMLSVPLSAFAVYLMGLGALALVLRLSPLDGIRHLFRRSPKAGWSTAP